MKIYHILSTAEFAHPIPIKDKDSADFFRAVLPPDENDSLFIVKDYYKNGKPKMIGKSTSQSYYPNLTGACMEFFINGRRKSVENYDKGKLKGDIVKYFPNGKLYLSGSYDENNKLIINDCNDSTGKKLVENGSGHCMEYTDDFMYVLAEGNMVNGVREGEWHGSLGDSGKYNSFYEKGILKKGISYDKKGNSYSFTTTDVVEPMFKGGEAAFIRFLGRNIHYPKLAKENNIQGKVFLSFIVNPDGKITDVRIIRNVGGGLGEEAQQVMQLSPPWIPGYSYGMPVRVAYTIPVGFTLSTDR
jgi:TonB family protein